MSTAAIVLLFGITFTVLAIGCFIYASCFWYAGEPASVATLRLLLPSATVSWECGGDTKAKFGRQCRVLVNIQGSPWQFAGTGDDLDQAGKVALTDLANQIKERTGNLDIGPVSVGRMPL